MEEVNNTNTRKEFSILEKFGFKAINYIKNKYPLPAGSNYMRITDPIFGNLEIKRNKANKIFVDFCVNHHPKDKDKDTASIPPSINK